jgi:hypothetical protein
MTLRIWLGALVAVGGLAACSADAENTTGADQARASARQGSFDAQVALAPTVTAAASGNIAGKATMYGGPSPGYTFGVRTGTLHVVGNGVDRTQALRADGSFGVSVPVGRYLVYAEIPQFNRGGECGSGMPGKVLVRSGSTVTVSIVCQMR